MQAGIGAVNDIDVPAAVGFDVIALYCDFAAFVIAGLNAAFLGRFGDRRNEIADFTWRIRIADIDRAGQKIAGTVNDSITLCMKRILKQATIVELENNPAELSKALTARTIDALGANRQRLTTIAAATPGTRLLPDDLFNVPQNIVVPKDRPAALAAVNALIDEARASGLLQRAIERGGAVGVAVAPAGVKAGCPG